MRVHAERSYIRDNNVLWLPNVDGLRYFASRLPRDPRKACLCQHEKSRFWRKQMTDFQLG